jgi:hypothetical protein
LQTLEKIAEERTEAKMAIRWSLEQSIENVMPLWPKLFTGRVSVIDQDLPSSFPSECMFF